jgi:8-oxo-dGTP diphosphatase
MGWQARSGLRTVRDMSLYLVRHASAGERGFGPDDRHRPLDEIGRARAIQIADQLATVATGRLLTSPYVRCVQTIEPLVARTATVLEKTTALAEAQPFEPVLDLLVSLPDGSVLCSHGDLIPDVMDALARRGMDIVGAPSWKKGVVWVLERDNGSVTSATVLQSTSSRLTRS